MRGKRGRKEGIMMLALEVIKSVSKYTANIRNVFESGKFRGSLRSQVSGLILEKGQREDQKETSGRGGDTSLLLISSNLFKMSCFIFGQMTETLNSQLLLLLLDLDNLN